MVISKAHERLQKRSLKSPNSATTTPDGGRSTSPESPFKLPPVQLQPSPSKIGAAASVADSSQYSSRPQVRVNPLYFQPDPATASEDVNVGSDRRAAHFPSTTTCSTFSSKARIRVRFAPPHSVLALSLNLIILKCFFLLNA